MRARKGKKTGAVPQGLRGAGFMATMLDYQFSVLEGLAYGVSDTQRDGLLLVPDAYQHE